MNEATKGTSLDEEIKVALAALKRARKRAEEIAERTGTAIIQADKDGAPIRVMPPFDGKKDSGP